jgi:hypothetical protein
MRRNRFTVACALALVLCVAMFGRLVSFNVAGQTHFEMLGADAPPFAAERQAGVMVHAMVGVWYQGWPLPARSSYSVGGPIYVTWCPWGVLADAVVLLILAGVMGLLAFQWFRTPRRSSVFCLCCAYSLTGNTSGICPECGTPSESKTAPIKTARI